MGGHALEEILSLTKSVEHSMERLKEELERIANDGERIMKLADELRRGLGR